MMGGFGMGADGMMDGQGRGYGMGSGMMGGYGSREICISRRSSAARSPKSRTTYVVNTGT